MDDNRVKRIKGKAGEKKGKREWEKRTSPDEVVLGNVLEIRAGIQGS